jgi:AGCS family alanine or glycine:cation symporter
VLRIDPATGLYMVEAGQIATIGGVGGVELTSLAFAQGISWFPYMLALVVLMFAFSTMISWSYYGLKAWTYLVGEGKKRELAFKLAYCGFVVIGAAAQLGSVIDFSDAMIFAMAVVNIIALYLLMPIVKRELDSYFARLHSGQIRKFTARPGKRGAAAPSGTVG